jgi:phosphate transport system substrate-binding protein
MRIRHRAGVLFLAVPLGACGLPPKATSIGRAPTPKVETSSAPSPAEQPPALTEITSGEKIVLHLHGSNTLGAAVAPRLAKAFLEKQGAREVFVNDESRAKERVWVQARVGDREVSIEIYAPGTKVGFETFERGWCDVVMASRPIADDEALRLARMGDRNSPPAENVVAMDGIAVIVNAANPVSKLTVRQLEQIFTGQVTAWERLGGRPGPIHVLARDERSGTHDAFVSLALRGKPPKPERSFEDSEALSRAVAQDERAIGFVGLPYVKQVKALAIQEAGARAMAPTAFTVATEDYALSRRLFFYTPSSPKDPMVKELLEFTLSDEGQAIVAEAGFVPLTLRTETFPVPPEAPPQYTRIAAGGTRLSVSLRFKARSATPDAKALRDIDRLVRHLASPVNKGRRIALAGFSDEGESAPERVSRQRVDAIATLLGQRGVKVADVGAFGAALAVAPSDLPDGRAKNRRVEVWLH